MSVWHMAVDVAGLIALWALTLVVIWFGFAAVGYGMDRWRNRRTLRILTEEGLEDELKRLNAERLVTIEADSPRGAGAWLVEDSKQKRSA